MKNIKLKALALCLTATSLTTLFIPLSASAQSVANVSESSAYSALLAGSLLVDLSQTSVEVIEKLAVASTEPLSQASNYSNTRYFTVERVEKQTNGQVRIEALAAYDGAPQKVVLLVDEKIAADAQVKPGQAITVKKTSTAYILEVNNKPLAFLQKDGQKNMFRQQKL